VIVRPATVDDIPELVRLRELLFRRVLETGDPADEGDWRERFAHDVEERLGTSLGIFVVDAPAVDGAVADGAVAGGAAADGAVDGKAGRLAACGLGLVEYRLPVPFQSGSHTGYVLGMVTDPAYRGQGYARLIMQELLTWFQERDVTRVDLHAPAEAAALYRSMGFQEHQVALSWHAP
jgi:ribosomal protein S18 acetylase RimI-like enzyme